MQKSERMRVVMIAKGQNPNHPKKGSSCKVQPIRSLEAIAKIKEQLQHQPRNLCLFVLGINTAYRASELLSLRIQDVAHIQVGDVLSIKQTKNQAYRVTMINRPAFAAIQNWLRQHPKLENRKAPFFISNHYMHRALTVSAMNHLIKRWCKDAGLFENYGSHSLRKTWGYHQRVANGASVALLVRAFGHASEAQTLDYLGILADEIKALYLELEL